jgi:hypothetical protein
MISLSFTLGFFGAFSCTATATELSSSPPVSLGISNSPVSAGVSSPASPARAIPNKGSLNRRLKGWSATDPVREIEIWLKANDTEEMLREDLVKRGEAVGSGRREEEAIGIG